MENGASGRLSWKYALILLAGFVAYLAYAGFALTRTFEALASGDAAKVQKYADFGTVRASLKSQVDSEIARSNAGLKKNGANIGELIGVGVLSALESGVANGIIEAVVTPDGLATILAGRKTAGQNSEDRGPQTLWRNIHIEGLDSIRFSRQAGFDAIFKFNGVSWKLVDVRVPFRDLIKSRAGETGR